MPHYDYHCQQCGYKLKEVFQKMSDSPLKECPSCHQLALQRGPGGGIGLQFQGSGFYITDYDPNRKKAEGSSDNKSNSCCPCGKSSSCSST